MAEDQEQGFDVKRAISRSTSKVTLKDLEKQGFRKVKVLRQEDILELIRQAVDDALATRGLTEGERDDVVAASREELDRLLKEHQAALRRQEELAAELTRLQTLKNHAEEERRALVRRFERGLASKQDVIDGYEAQIGEAQAEAASVPALREQAAEFQAQIAELTTRLRKAEAAPRAASVDVTALRNQRDDLVRQLKNVTVARNLLAEVEVPRLKDRVAALDAELEEARAAASSRLPRAQESTSEERLEAVFERLVSTMSAERQGQDLQVKLNELVAKLEKATTERRPTVTGEPLDDQAAGALAKSAISSLFEPKKAAARIESNVPSVKVREHRAGGVGDSLKRLRSLRKEPEDE